MRLLNLVTVLSTALVTQSCKIEMPPFVELVGSYSAAKGEAPHNFSRYSMALQKKGFKDTLIIGDTPNSGHEEYVKKSILNWGVPEKHIVTRIEFKTTGDRGNTGLRYLSTLDDWESLRRATRVVHLPLRYPLVWQADVPRIKANNIMFVLSANNMREEHGGDRDQYNINHVIWSHDDSLRNDRLKKRYQALLDVHKTGKVVAATSAKITRRVKRIVPSDWVVSCGDIKKSCYTVIPQQPTSRTSAHLSAMSFYLAQFYSTAEEIVETLEKCAVDIGEEGIDREYGRGLANLLCPRVLKKELEAVSEFLGEEEKKEERVSSGEGLLEGVWKAEDTSLEVYLPLVLRETLQAHYEGIARGTIVFKEDSVAADFGLSAIVKTSFLMPIEAKAEDTVSGEGRYSVEESMLTTQTPEPVTYGYTVTEDSLKLIRSFTLNEILRLLPGELGKLAKKEETEDWFQEDPIKIIATFAREILLGDFNKDNIVDFTDFLLFTTAFGTDNTHSLFNERMDLVPDGMINFADFLVFVENFGKTG